MQDTKKYNAYDCSDVLFSSVVQSTLAINEMKIITKVSISVCKAGVNFLNLGSVNNSETIPRHFSNVCESV